MSETYFFISNKNILTIHLLSAGSNIVMNEIFPFDFVFKTSNVLLTLVFVCSKKLIFSYFKISNATALFLGKKLSSTYILKT